VRLTFADCLLDTERRQLERRGAPVHLPPKAYRLLEVLIEERPRALSKRELIVAVWPGLFVGESSLTNVVARLREAVGDTPGRSRSIRTVHGYGYALQADVRILAGGASDRAMACRLIWDGREVLLTPGENLLGRAPDAAVWIQDEQVSRRHALIVVGETVTLEDLGSRNGTYHAGRRLGGPVVLADRDRVRIGRATVTVRLLRSDALTVPMTIDESGPLRDCARVATDPLAFPG
jgi:DNA-binding winged helix-turn-helix (wHTH) protein